MELSPVTNVLTNPEIDDLKAAHKRWTELEHKTTGTI